MKKYTYGNGFGFLEMKTFLRYVKDDVKKYKKDDGITL